MDYDISPHEKIKFINFKALARALQYEIKLLRVDKYCNPLVVEGESILTSQDRNGNNYFLSS